MVHSDCPPGGHVLREFTITRDSRGRWVACETHGLAAGVFFTREQAFRFALREVDDDPSRVHLGMAEVPAGA